jgi:hypothetical protein
MSEVLFVVEKETHVVDGKTCRWGFVNSCPHGEDMGAVELSDTAFDAGPPVAGSTRRRLIWEWHDLGNGRCRISPSLLVPGHHNGVDCHFGPGEFAFVWLELGQLRDGKTGLPEQPWPRSASPSASPNESR